MDYQRYVGRSKRQFPEGPWLHQEAANYLGYLLKRTDSVLEYGAGGSTVWIASKVSKLITYESDPEWVAATILALEQRGLNRVAEVRQFDLVTRSIDLDPSLMFDVIFVDGDTSARTTFILKTMDRVSPGGVLVLDNTRGIPSYPDKWDIHYGYAPALEALRDWPREDVWGQIEAKYNCTSFWTRPRV